MFHVVTLTNLRLAGLQSCSKAGNLVHIQVLKIKGITERRKVWQLQWNSGLVLLARFGIPIWKCHKSLKSHKVLDVRRQVTNGIGLFRFLIGCTHASYFTNNSCRANEPWRFRKWYQQQCQHPHCCFHPVGQTSSRHNPTNSLSWIERLTWERPRFISRMQAHFHMSKSQDWVYMFASLSAGHTHLSSWRETLQELVLSRLLDNDAHCT